MVAEMFHADTQRDMIKLIVAFGIYENALKFSYIHTASHYI